MLLYVFWPTLTCLNPNLHQVLSPSNSLGTQHRPQTQSDQIHITHPISGRFQPSSSI